MSNKIRVSSHEKEKVSVSENKSNNISVNSESNSEISIQEGQTINIKDISVTLSEFIQESITASSDSIGLTKNVTYTGSDTVESIISDIVSTSDVDIDLQVELDCLDEFHPGRRGVLSPLRSKKFMYGDLYMLHGLKINIEDTHNLLSDTHQMYLISDALDIEEAISPSDLGLNSWSDNNGSIHIYSGSSSLSGDIATFLNSEFPWPETPQVRLDQYLEPRGRFLHYGDNEVKGSYDVRYDIDFKVKMTKIVGGQEVDVFSNECVFSFVKLAQLIYSMSIGGGGSTILNPYLQAPFYANKRLPGSQVFSLLDTLATDEDDFSAVTDVAKKYSDQKIAPNYDDQVIVFENPGSADSKYYFGLYQQGYIAVPYPYAINTNDPSSVMFKGIPVGNSLFSLGPWITYSSSVAIAAEFDEGVGFDDYGQSYAESLPFQENQVFHDLTSDDGEDSYIIGSDGAFRLDLLANTGLVNTYYKRPYAVRLYAFSQLQPYKVGDRLSVRFTKLEVPIINIDTDNVFSTFVEESHRFNVVRGLFGTTGNVHEKYIDPISETGNLILENGYNNYGSSRFEEGGRINVDVFKADKFKDLSLSVSQEPGNTIRIKKPNGTFASPATHVLSGVTDGEEEDSKRYSLDLPSLINFNGVGTPNCEIYRPGTRAQDCRLNYKFECTGLKDSQGLAGTGAYVHHKNAEGTVYHEIRNRSFMFVSNLDLRESINNGEGFFDDFEGNLDFAVPSGNYVNMDGQKVSTDPEDGTGHSNRFMHYLIAGSSSGGSTALDIGSDLIRSSNNTSLTFSPEEYGFKGYYNGVANSDVSKIACRHAIDADAPRINFQYGVEGQNSLYTARFDSSKNPLSEFWVPHYEGATNIQRYPGALVKSSTAVFLGGSSNLMTQRWERNNLTASSDAFLYRAVPYRLFNTDVWMYTNDNDEVVTRFRVQNTTTLWPKYGLTIYGNQFSGGYVFVSPNLLSNDEADDEMLVYIDRDGVRQPVTFTMTNQYGVEEEYVLFQSLTEMGGTSNSGPLGPIFNYPAYGLNP